MKRKQIATLNDICKYLENMDMTGYCTSPNTITVEYRVVDKKTGNVETEHRSFTGKSVEDIYKKISKWTKSKSLWVKQGRLLSVNDPADPFDFDLEYELLSLGFKYAEVSYEYTNFVEVWVTYCYIDNNGKFRYDGGLVLDSIGDKYETLRYLKDWIASNPYFVPCKNKL